MWIRTFVALGIAAGTLAAALSATPRTVQAEEGDRCGGTTQPVCRKIEVCAAIPGTDTQVCDRNFYYFPSDA